MKRTDQHAFDNYARHYAVMNKGIDRLPQDIEKLRRDRIPRCMTGIPLNSRILDAGCAQGYLLAALQRVGYSSLTGVDISFPLIEEAKSLLGQTVSLYVSDVYSFLEQQAEASYDVIFLHDVLEHLPREMTIETLSQLYRNLAPGGVLSVRVPNMGSLLAGYTAHIDFTHITQFTEYALTQVLESAGFSPAKITYERQAPTLFWSWHKPHRSVLRIINRCRWQINNEFHRFVYRLSDMSPMPTIFDFNIVVIAKK